MVTGKTILTRCGAIKIEDSRRFHMERVMSGWNTDHRGVLSMKRWMRWAPASITAILITALPLLAHHGSAGYDTRNPVTLTGTIRNIEWMNPHCFIYLDVTRDNGIVETWALEGTPPNALERFTGWTKDTFKPG